MVWFSWNFTLPQELDSLICSDSLEYSISDADTADTFDHIQQCLLKLNIPPLKEFLLDQAYMEEFLTFPIVFKALEVFATKEKVQAVKKLTLSFHLVEPGFDSSENLNRISNFVMERFPNLEDITWISALGPTTEQVERLVQEYSLKLRALNFYKRADSDTGGGLDDSLIPLILNCPNLVSLHVPGQFSRGGVKQIKTAIEQGVSRISDFKYKF
jgi:hypothetical protein